MRVEKYKAGDFRKILQENYREKDKDGNLIHYKNKYIDPSRTHLNKQLRFKGRKMDFRENLEYMKDRKESMSNSKVLNRPNINVMGSIVLTLPEELKDRSDEFKYKFFRHAYIGLSIFVGDDKYENALNGHVHMDETSPHMHFNFLPITDDGKGGQKMSFKEAFPRTKYKQLHPFMQEYLTKALGEPITLYEEKDTDPIKDPETNKNYTTDELKDMTNSNFKESERLLAEANAEMVEITKEYKRTRKELNEREQSIDEREKELKKRFRAYIEELERKIRQANEVIAMLKDEQNKFKSSIELKETNENVQKILLDSGIGDTLTFDDYNIPDF